MRWLRTGREDEDPRTFDFEHAEGPTEVSTFVEDLRTAFPEPRVEDPMRHVQLAAMAEAARPDAATHPAVVPATPRRSPVFKSLAAKITAAAVVVFASFGGLATAGALPRPVQHGVARVADTVGLNIPDPDEQDDQSGDQSGPNDQSGDQGESGYANDQPGDNNDQTGQSGDQGTSGDAEDQSGDSEDQTGQAGDEGTSGDGSEQSGDNNDQTGQSGDEGTSGDENGSGSQSSGDQGGE